MIDETDQLRRPPLAQGARSCAASGRDRQQRRSGRQRRGRNRALPQSPRTHQDQGVQRRPAATRGSARADLRAHRRIPGSAHRQDPGGLPPEAGTACAGALAGCRIESEGTAAPQAGSGSPQSGCTSGQPRFDSAAPDRSTRDPGARNPTRSARPVSRIASPRRGSPHRPRPPRTCRSARGQSAS